MTKPTKLKDLPKAEQDALLGAWFRDEELEMLTIEGDWVTRPETNGQPTPNVAYRIKLNPMTEATELLKRWINDVSDDYLWQDTKGFIDRMNK